MLTVIVIIVVMAEQVSDQIVSRKPKDDAFRQQRMISWQPIMTPIKVVLIFLAVGVAFIPTGTTTTTTYYYYYYYHPPPPPPSIIITTTATPTTPPPPPQQQQLLLLPQQPLLPLLLKLLIT